MPPVFFPLFSRGFTLLPLKKMRFDATVWSLLICLKIKPVFLQEELKNEVCRIRRPDSLQDLPC